MIRVFKHYVPYAVLLLGLIDFALLMVAAEAGWTLRLWQLVGRVRSGPRAAAQHARLRRHAAGGDGRGRRLRRRGAALDALRRRAPAGRGVARLPAAQPRLLRLSAGQLLALEPALRDVVRASSAWSRSGSRCAARWAASVQAAPARARRGRARGADRGAGRAQRRELPRRRLRRHERRRLGGRRTSVNRDDIASLPDHLLRLGASEVVLALEERRNALPLERPAPDQDHRRHRQRFLLLPRARDRAGSISTASIRPG